MLDRLTRPTRVCVLANQIGNFRFIVVHKYVLLMRARCLVDNNLPFIIIKVPRVSLTIRPRREEGSSR